jgi:hypothetical protein
LPGIFRIAPIEDMFKPFQVAAGPRITISFQEKEGLIRYAGLVSRQGTAKEVRRGALF